MNQGPFNCSGLCSGKNAAVAYRTDRQTFKLTGCQFIGHHLVPHHGSSSVRVHNLDKLTQENKDLCKSEVVSFCVVFDGSLQVTALPVEHAQLPHGVAVTSSEHQKAQLPRCWLGTLRSTCKEDTNQGGVWTSRDAGQLLWINLLEREKEGAGQRGKEKHQSQSEDCARRYNTGWLSTLE